MGRGRAKAKQTKIARELKYTGAGGDLTHLQAELRAVHDVEDEVYEMDREEDEGIDEE
jgi:hypothetical protein